MYKRFILLGLLISSMGVFAQSSYLGLSMGIASPTGDFAAQDSYAKSGYAQNGFNLSFEGVYIPTWYFGVASTFGFATNFPDEGAMLEDILADLDPDLPNLPSDAQIDFLIENWSYVNFMIGPALAVPMNKFQFDVKAQVGFSIVMPPGENLSISYNEFEYLNYTDNQVFNFSYAFGGDLIYKMSGNYSLKLGCEYFASAAKYEIDYTVDDGDGEETFASRKSDVKISAVHATLGFAYLF